MSTAWVQHVHFLTISSHLLRSSIDVTTTGWYLSCMHWDWHTILKLKLSEAKWSRMKTHENKGPASAVTLTTSGICHQPALHETPTAPYWINYKHKIYSSSPVEGWVRAGKIWKENRSKLPLEVDMFLVQAKRNLNPARQGPWQGIHGRNIRDIVPDPSDQIVEYYAVCVDVNLERSGSMKTSLAAILVS